MSVLGGDEAEVDEVPPVGVVGVDATRSGEPSSRRRKVQTAVAMGAGGLVFFSLVLAAVSWVLVQPRDQVAFFRARPGEHRPLVFAHQGGEGLRPGNTAIAFRHALDLGADVLDTDVNVTRDGVLVLLHDETVDRTSDGHGRVGDLTLAELRELDFGYTFSTDGGVTFPYRGTGQRIVTVGEFFSEFTATRFGIEIKKAPAEAARDLCALIQEFGYEDRVLVSSSDQENMDVFREKCPSVATSATTGEARRFYIFQFIGLSGFYSPPFDSLQVPEYQGGTHVLTGRFVSAANRWNLPVVPWTIDEPSDFERLISDFDVDGINTNYPDRLIGFLADQ